MHFKTLPKVQLKKSGVKRKAEKNRGDDHLKAKKLLLEEKTAVGSSYEQETSAKGSQQVTRRRSERLKGKV